MKPKATNIEVKKNNRNQIFRYICECDTVSNPDISYELKISLPTVTQNTKELLEKGLIVEAGEMKSTGGRRAKALSVAADFRLAVGIDITRNHIGYILTNLIGNILQYKRIYLPFQPDETYYQEANKRLEEFLEEWKVERDKVLGIGISFPGIVDLENEEITSSHVLGIGKIAFQKISRYFSYPCSILNDANAGAYAEGWRAKIPERFFYLSLSNTVGGAIYNYDELVQGKSYRCGEVGHMTVVPGGEVCYCKKRGCLDVYCSAKKLSSAADGKLGEFFELLDRGDKDALDIWERYTEYLAMAIHNIHMILDCDIVIGGYVGSYVEKHIQDIWEKVSSLNTFEEHNIFVRACRYKVGAAALGAALKVIEMFVEQV